MKKTRILYLITGLTPGGAELTLKNIILNLNKNHFDIFVCSITNTMDIVHSIKHKINKLYTLDVNSVFDFIKAFIKLRKIIKSVKPQIIHCFMFHSNILGRFVAKEFRCKLICSIRTKLIYNRFGNFLDAISQILVDVYTVNSYSLKKFINRYGINRRKIVIIENGINFKNFKTIKEAGEIKKELNLPNIPIITMIANFKKQKDYPTMIKAIAHLQKEKDVYFLAVGTGLKFEDEKKKIELLIKQLNLKNVKFLGFRDDIPDILNITDIWVSSTLYEGQSNSLLEAMAMRKPIVTTDIPENAEVVRNGKEAILVPVKSPDKLAKAIKKLLINKNFSKKIAENAYKRVHKKYNIHKTFNKLEKLYNIVINQRKKKISEFTTN